MPNQLHFDMSIFDDLQKNRKLISQMLKSETNGEISDFDFIVSFVSFGKPIVTILLGVPAKVKREYDFDMDELLDKHEDTIRQVISVVGFPEVFNRTIHYQVL